MSEVNIIRVDHKFNPYFMYRRETAQDEALSWEARGVLAYLLSKPDDWQVRVSDLEQGCGRDKVRGILKELIDRKYVRKFDVRDADTGKYSGVEYKVYEMPIEVDIEPNSPETENPATVLPEAANPEHTYNRVLHNTESTQPPSSSAGRKPIVNMNSKSKPENGGDEGYYSDENAKPAPRKKCALELRIEKEIPSKRKLSATAANLLTLSVETSEGPQASPCILWDVNPYFPEWVEQRIAYWKTLSSSDATHLINLLRKYDNGEHGWLHFNEVKHKMKEAEDAKRTAYDPGDVPGIKSEQVDKDWSKVSWDDIEES